MPTCQVNVCENKRMGIFRDPVQKLSVTRYRKEVPFERNDFICLFDTLASKYIYSAPLEVSLNAIRSFRIMFTVGKMSYWVRFINP